VSGQFIEAYRMSTLLSRRQFALAGAALSSGLSAAAPGIIDTHVHFYDPRRPQGVPWPPKNDSLLYRPVLPPEYEALVRPLGVTGTIVVEASPWLGDNQWILDLARDHPIILGVVGNLQPEGFARNLERFAANPLFRGLRLGGAALARQLPGMENLRRLAEADLTLDAIGNAAMAQTLVTVTDKVPDLRIAINHMPVEPTGWTGDASARAAIRELGKRPRVYAKVSGVLRREDGRVLENPSDYRAALDEVWDLFGPDRVMYGSNWPVSDRLGPYAVVLNVVTKYLGSAGPAAAEKYFRRNSQSCYKWTARVGLN
jgi:predicted TIM-barrel fold metal-dependent hydrolase